MLLFNEHGITQPQLEQVISMKYVCSSYLKVRNLMGQGTLLMRLSRWELPQYDKQPSWHSFSYLPHNLLKPRSPK